MSVIQLMIAESETGQLRILLNALDKQNDMKILSTVSTREGAIKELSKAPDIMIINPDVLKDHSLSRFLRSVQAQAPHTRVMCFLRSTLADDKLISDLKTGIRGHIKSADLPATMIKAIRSVHGGEIWAERRILEKAMANPMLLPETLQAHLPGSPPLTNREMEMLTLVLQGASNREIADRSSISERTVKTHLYRVYQKLNVKSRTKAIALLSQQ